MSRLRPAARSARSGEKRACPHCRTVMLASLAVCPKCGHHVAFGGTGEARERRVPLTIEGAISSDAGTPVEYMVTVTICDEKGNELDRQIVGVGALSTADKRTIRLTVETYD